MRVYTRKGDDGSTGLLYGGRVSKASPAIEATGAIDEAQAALGVVRAEAAAGSELDAVLVGLERDLYVAMAETATAGANRARLVAGSTLVTPAMVAALEPVIDDLSARFPPLADFVIPGQGRVPALLDVARTTIRRAERLVVAAQERDQATAGGDQAPASLVGAYLNRLSDLVWTMARWQEQGDSMLSREA
ncbi:MAG: cob(I)yrinic acid a,c-diamide adenosyltransferase [Acidimicrobiales bacterium]